MRSSEQNTAYLEKVIQTQKGELKRYIATEKDQNLLIENLKDQLRKSRRTAYDV